MLHPHWKLQNEDTWEQFYSSCLRYNGLKQQIDSRYQEAEAPEEEEDKEQELVYKIYDTDED